MTKIPLQAVAIVEVGYNRLAYLKDDLAQWSADLQLSFSSQDLHATTTQNQVTIPPIIPGQSYIMSKLCIIGRSCGLMDKALASRAGDCGFESHDD